MLISEGFRTMLSVDSTEENGKIFLEFLGKKYETQVVGLMNKVGSQSFTSRKIHEQSQTIGKSCITTYGYYKMLLDDMAKREPSVKLQLEQINA